MSDYEIPDNCEYTEHDEWIRMDGTRALIGISDYAQQQLGDIVFVELPSPGQQLSREASFGAIESVKAVSDLYSPIDGTVSAVNEALVDRPEIVNEDCYGDGWLIAIEPAGAMPKDAMNAAAYLEYLSQRED